MPVESVPTSSDAARAGLPRIVLILGGARSGKSRFAETLVAQASAKALYIATAERRDAGKRADERFRGIRHMHVIPQRGAVRRGPSVAVHHVLARFARGDSA